VKVTLEIPDTIFRRVKACAAVLEIPVRQFITEAVTDKLATPGLSPDKPWMRGFGALRHLHKETMRIQRLIDEEFEQIERS
jgi:hypothetical protein